MRLTAIDRELMTLARNGKPFPKVEDGNRYRRQLLRNAGYIVAVKHVWYITDAGLAALNWKPDPETGVTWRDMTERDRQTAVQKFIADWCASNKQNYNEICIAPRSKARQALCIAMKVEFPDLGPSFAASYLGGLDHTTVYYAWKKAGVHKPKPITRRANPKPKTYHDSEDRRKDREFARKRREVIREEARQKLLAEKKRVVMRMP